MIKEYFLNMLILFPMFVIYVISYLFYFNISERREKFIKTAEYAQLLCFLFSLSTFYKGVSLINSSPITLRDTIMGYSFFSFIVINILSTLVTVILAVSFRINIILNNRRKNVF